MKGIKGLIFIITGIFLVFSCSQDDNGLRPVLASPIIKLIPEMDTFSGNVGDTLEVNIAVEGERVFQTIKVNKIINSGTEEPLIQIGDPNISIMPPYQENFKYTLDEKDIGRSIELEFRLDRREETPSGGTQFGFSSVRLKVITHE